MQKRTYWIAPAVLVLVTLLVGCQSGSEQTQKEEAESASKEKAKGERKESKPEKVTVAAGTPLQVRLVDTIDTGKTEQGAKFEGTLAAALVVEGKDLAPVGSSVTGKVTHVVSSGRLSRPAELALVLTSLTPKEGERTQISTHPWEEKAKSHKKRDVETIGGGAAVGALIGALAGGKKGAAIGGAVGAGGGTGVAAATGKKEIVLPPETKLTFKLSSAVTLPARK